MYTVCWVEQRHRWDGMCDRWERCKSKEDVANLLIENRLEDDPDVLIFGPEANEYLLMPGDFVSE